MQSNATASIHPRNSLKAGYSMKGNIYPTYKRRHGKIATDADGNKIQAGWQVRFGAKIGRHFPLNNLIGAERYLNFLRHQEDEGIFDPRDHQARRNPLGLKKQGDKWLALKKKQIKPRSYANLARYMKCAYDYFGRSTNVKVIGYAQLEDFLFKKSSWSEKTRANCKSVLHSFFKWASRRECIPMPDMPDVTYELEWRNVVDIQTQQNIISTVKELSFKVNPKIWFAINCLATYISIRPSELVVIKEKEIDTNMGCFIIPHPKEKRPKVAYLLGDDLRFIKSLPRGLPDMYFFRHPPGLRGAQAGQRFGNRYLYKWWKKACAELGIDGVDLYGGTRHSTATALGRICTPEEVRDATGHTSKAFERYFQNKQARALRVTQKIKELRGEIHEFRTDVVSKKRG